jgi:hypothetical protein
MRFGLTDGQPKTLDEIGKVYGVTRERIRQIESKTMSKLRHPSRSQVLGITGLMTVGQAIAGVLALVMPAYDSAFLAAAVLTAALLFTLLLVARQSAPVAAPLLARAARCAIARSRPSSSAVRSRRRRAASSTSTGR